MYREIAPPPALANLVECAWVFLPAAGQVAQHVFPDGCADFVALSNRVDFWGPATAAIRDALAPEAHVGVRFRPSGLRVIFGVAPLELQDQRVPAKDILGSACGRLEDAAPALVSSAKPIQMFGAVERIFRALVALGKRGEPDFVVQAAMEKLERDPNKRVQALAGELRLSERQLRRRFEAETGLGMKRMARILRFQRLLNHLRRPRINHEMGWAEISVEFGYADQAHLVHDTGVMAGMSPSALATQLGTTR